MIFITLVYSWVATCDTKDCACRQQQPAFQHKYERLHVMQSVL